MAFPTYTTADTLDGTVDEGLLHTQIIADPLITTPFLGVTRTGDSFSLEFSSVPPAAEQTECDAVVAAHTSLPAVKGRLLDDIKAHRDSQRLAYDLHAEYPAASGNLFSCSPASQNNWAKLATLDVQAAVVYPFAVTTYNELATYNLIDTADRQAATLAISAVVLGERTLATTYIAAVLAATSAAAAQAAAAPYLAL